MAKFRSVASRGRRITRDPHSGAIGMRALLAVGLGMILLVPARERAADQRSRRARREVAAR